MEADEGAQSLEAAIEELERREPHSQRATVVRASWLEQQGRSEEAVEVLEAFAKKHRDCGVARTNLARLQWKAGQRPQALANLRLGLITDPNQGRALHLYAALLEEDSSFSGALGSLRLLAGRPGAWLPAWVGAQLAASREPAEVGPLLLLAAQQSQQPFPPHPGDLRDLVKAVSPGSQRELAQNLRPYCTSEAQRLLDALLAEPATLSSPVQGLVVTLLRRSVWRHASQPQGTVDLGLSPVVVIRPEEWGVGEVAGRLSRGLALLAIETLDALAGCSAAVLVESVPEAGVVTRESPLTGELLASQAKGGCTHLLSSYLSFRSPTEFILDAEIYDRQGSYVGRESCRAPHPGACVQQLAQRLCASLATTASGSEPSPPLPDLELEDALAREAVASLLLCAEGALHLRTLGNPGRLLDGLVEYAVQRESASSLLTLWAATEAAARAGLSGGEPQREILSEVLAANEALAFWIGRS